MTLWILVHCTTRIGKITKCWSIFYSLILHRHLSDTFGRKPIMLLGSGMPWIYSPTSVFSLLVWYTHSLSLYLYSLMLLFIHSFISLSSSSSSKGVGAVCMFCFGLSPYFSLALGLRCLSGFCNSNTAITKAVLSDMTTGSFIYSLVFNSSLFLLLLLLPLFFLLQ